MLGLRRDAPVQGAQSRTRRQEPEDVGICSGRMMSRNLMLVTDASAAVTAMG